MTGTSVPSCGLRKATLNVMSPLWHREDVEEEHHTLIHAVELFWIMITYGAF